jgi:hypothetical protein
MGCCGNYASRLKAQLDIKKNGYVRLSFADKGIKPPCIEASCLKMSKLGKAP